MTKAMKFFKDDQGKVVIVQTPNIPLIGWFVFAAASHFIKTSSWQELTSYVSFGFLVIWAWLEISFGKSNFRRVLGLVVFLAALYSQFK